MSTENRWAAFSDEELIRWKQGIPSVDMWTEIEAELARRKAEGGK